MANVQQFTIYKREASTSYKQSCVQFRPKRRDTAAQSSRNTDDDAQEQLSKKDFYLWRNNVEKKLDYNLTTTLINL